MQAEQPINEIEHPFGDLIGLEISEAKDGCSIARLQVVPSHMNAHGVVHGAVLFALSDTSMGAAVKSLLGPGETCATIELQIRFFAPVREGSLTAATEAVSRGRRVMQLESRITDASGRLVATAMGSFAVLGT